ncbi:MAG: hypothetical protein H6734_04505 [Alphaproteobacteria bacterium]|nr:hypothetical protein [Alphaproteobacteria bacterium]
MFAMLLGSALAGDVWLVIDTEKVHGEIPATWIDASEEPEVAALVAQVARRPVGTSVAMRTEEGVTGQLVHRATVEPGPRELRIQRGDFAFSTRLRPEAPAISMQDLDVVGGGLSLSLDDASAWDPLLRAAPTVLLAGKGEKPVVIEVR